MNDEPKPLADELSRLVRAERDTSDVPEDAQARVMARLIKSVAVPSSGEGANGGGSVGRATSAVLRSPALLTGVFALGVATGVVGTRLVTPSSNELPAALPPPSAQARAPATPEPLSNQAPEATPIPSYASPSLLPTTRIAAAPSASASPARQLADEQAILDIARAALNRGEWEAALGAVDRHERRYPGGLLAEEREVLAIEALVLAGHADEGRARAGRFEKRYPRSVLLPTVQAVVAPPSINDK